MFRCDWLNLLICIYLISMEWETLSVSILIPKPKYLIKSSSAIGRTIALIGFLFPDHSMEYPIVYQYNTKKRS